MLEQNKSTTHYPQNTYRTHITHHEANPFPAMFSLRISIVTPTMGRSNA